MPTTAQQLLLLMSAGGVSYEDYITNTISPLLWLRLNETSGNPVNHGSATGLTLSVSGATQGQTGQLGANEAYLSDGVDDIVCQIGNDAQLANLTTQRWAFLVNATSLGETDSGAFFVWGAGFSNANHMFRMNALNGIRAFIRAATTHADAQTDNQQIVDVIGSWAWLFMDYDDADSLGNGRKIRLFKGLSSTVTQLTLQTDTAAVGAVTNQAQDLFIGNRSTLSLTFDGLFDEVLCNADLWTNDEMQRLVDLSGV